MSNLYKQRAADGEGKGGNKYTILNVPDFKIFKPKEGKGVKNRINILKYPVGSKNHPLVRKGDLKIGSLDFMFTWFEHSNVGPDKAKCICLKKTYGMRCPMCEARQELIDQGLSWDDPQVKPYSASERSAFYVQDVSGDVAGEVEIFPVSSFLFTKKLLAAAADDEVASEYTDNFVEFAEPGRDGRVVAFKSKTEGEGKKKKTEYDSFAFESRDQKYKIPSSDLELPSMDKYLKVLTYDQIKAMMEGEEVSAEEEEEAPKPAPKKKVVEEEEEEAPKAAPKKKPIDDDEDVKVDFEDDKPKAKPKKEVEEEEEKPKAKCQGCPKGHDWGSADDFPADCNKCNIDLYEACVKAAK